MLNCYQLSFHDPLPALADPFPASPGALPASPDEPARTFLKWQSAVETSHA
jgi:hypothetical protein